MKKEFRRKVIMLRKEKNKDFIKHNSNYYALFRF